jgi:lysophospholipid acyltransferase (LPLAT)-like uncharacterized protein
MKLRQPWMIKLAALIGAILLRLWMSTIRYRIVLADRSVDPVDPSFTGRYIYALWHETLIGMAGRTWGAKMHMLVSHHADGELIARICQHIGWGVVRGSTTRGGATAMREMLNLSREALLAVTPDGPRGPRRQVQPGIAFLASHTALAIVPIGVAYRRAWRARTWDRFAIPWPWTTAVCVTASTVHVPPDLRREELEHYRLLVEERMLEATAEAEKRATR